MNFSMLMDMPEVALRVLINKLNMLQIINVSLASPRLARFAKNHLKSKVIMKIKMEKTKQSIYMKMGLEVVEWEFRHGKSVKNFKCHTNLEDHSPFPLGTPFTEIRSRMLWLFGRAHKEIVVDVNVTMKSLSFLNNFTTDIFMINGKLTRKKLSWWRRLFANSMTIRDMLHLNIDVTEAEMVENIDWRSLGYHGHSFIVERAAWFSASMLYQVRATKEFTVFGALLSNQDVNVFIKKWLNGEMEVSIVDIRPPWSIRLEYEEVLQGIEHSEWDRTERGQSIPWANTVLDLSTARDIQRADGKLASIRISWNALFMIVWNERFPTLPTLPNVNHTM